MSDASEHLFRFKIASLSRDFWKDVAQMESFAMLKHAHRAILSDIAGLQADREELLTRRRGGGGKGRRIIKRDFERAYQTIFQQYFSVHVPPMYNDSLFLRRFRVPKSVFQKVMNALSRDPLFQVKRNAAHRWGIHPLVKATAVFRHFAYGTSADQLDEQLQIAESTFLKARQRFCDIVIETFGSRYLPDMSVSLASKLIAKHERLGWPGLLGSLDCSHWAWAKCPKSWQGDFKKGSLESPTIVYECACDADLFIFHCNFAAPGSNNDINVR
jgi:hypothetical protein